MHSILMPTEIINRDLDFQVMLAARVVRPGVRVFLGRADAIHRVAHEVEGGMFIGKAFDPFFPEVDTRFYRLLKQQGTVVLHLDDEGAVFLGDRNEWRETLLRRFDPAQITTDDYVCAWGDWQRDLYRSTGAREPSRVRTTGHPRFDFLRSAMLRDYYAPAAAALTERHGSFLLLNTNLQVANNGLGLKYTFTKRFGYDVTDRAKKTKSVTTYAHATTLLVNFVRLAHRLADEFPDLKIIVRPHPSEDQKYYRTVFTGVPNVLVLHEGSVIPWLLASRALIHDGCTTGIEAALAGVPIVNYKSIADVRYDAYLPNLFGTRCTTEDEAVLAVRNILAGNVKAPPPTELPIGDDERALLANFNGETFDRLLEVVREADSDQRVTSMRTLRLKAREQAARFVENAKSLVRRVAPAGVIENAYSRNKFYGFRAARVERRILDAERVTGRKLRLSLHGDNLLSLDA